MKLIDHHYFESMSPLFRGNMGRRLAEVVIHFLAIDRVNWVYEHSYSFSGPEFASHLLDDLGVNYMIGNAEKLWQLPEGAFITVSNHPYGGLDGIIMVDLFGAIRPDYKFMVNKFLSMIKTLNESFISVIPTADRKTDLTSETIKGIRETISHLHKGHPAGFFPSGAVSDFSLRDFRIRDRKWQSSIMHLIHSARVPILPVRFFGNNSLFFYLLGLVHWKIRSMRLPYEVFNKHNNKVRLGIGKLITPDEQLQFPDFHSFGEYLRKSVYEMAVPAEFVHRKEFFGQKHD
jgi:putative hemolysin